MTDNRPPIGCIALLGAMLLLIFVFFIYGIAWICGDTVDEPDPNLQIGEIVCIKVNGERAMVVEIDYISFWEWSRTNPWGRWWVDCRVKATSELVRFRGYELEKIDQ
jgi:hypothetical protein